MSFVPLFLLVALVVRALFVGAGIGDALAMFALAALQAYQLYLEATKVIPVSEAIMKEVQIIKDSLASVKLGRTYGK